MLPSWPVKRNRWLQRVLGLNDPSPGDAWLWVGCIVLGSAMCGVLTAAVGTKFQDRPIFYLAVPLAIALVAMAVGDPRRLLIGLVVLRAILDPVFQRAQLPGIGGLGGLLNFVMIGVALTLLTLERGRVTQRESWVPWMPFIAVMALALTHAPDRMFGLRSWLSLLTYAAVYHGAFYCANRVDGMTKLLNLQLLSSVPVFIYAIVSFLVYGASYTLEAGDGDATSGRLSEPLAHPNILGFYCVLMLGVWLLRPPPQTPTPLFTLRNLRAAIYLCLLLGVLGGTQTRSAWAGALFLLLVYGVFVRRAALVLLLVGGVLALGLPEVRDRIVDLASNNEVYTYSRLNSYAWRQYLWQSALAAMSPLSYIIGNGYAAFWTNSPSFFPLSDGLNWGAHNVYMQLLFDSGIVGVIAFLSIYAIAARLVWTRVSLPTSSRIMTIALLGCFTFMSYSDNMLDYLVVNWNVWFVIGLVVASSAGAKMQRQRTP